MRENDSLKVEQGMDKTECTVLVCSCDSYEDAWEPFFKLFWTYWPECPYEVILNTETKIFTGDKVKCFSFYDKDESVFYGERLLKHLRQIESPYVLILMDDFFFRKQVNGTKIKFYIDQLKKNPDIAVFSFDSVADELNIDDGKYQDFLLRPRYGEYKMNFQGGVWNKETLMKCIRPFETPWEIESKGSIRTFEMQERFYTLKDLSLSPIDYGKKKGLTWGIVRGKWIYDDVVPLFQRHRIDVDYAKRGFFDPDNYKNITIPPKRTIYQNMQSYGIRLWIKMNLWRAFRAIKKLLHMKYDVDYIAYKRRLG